MKHAHDTGLKNDKGENNGRSKLTDKKVKQIRLIKHLTQKDIAKLYGISPIQVYRIRAGKNWSHVV